MSEVRGALRFRRAQLRTLEVMRDTYRTNGPEHGLAAAQMASAVEACRKREPLLVQGESENELRLFAAWFGQHPGLTTPTLDYLDPSRPTGGR